MDQPAGSGKITAVQAQLRRRGRVNVHLDDQFAFSLSIVVAERAGLRPGLFLSTADRDRLAQEDAQQIAMDCALHYLSYRQRSERELRQNLARRGIPPERTEQVIARLKEMRLLDDSAFAQFWVESRDRFSPRGTRALRAELFRKGLDRQSIDSAISAGTDEETRASMLVEKKLAALRGLDYRTFHQRLLGVLLRRGFSYDIAGTVVRNAWQRSGGANDDASAE